MKEKVVNLSGGIASLARPAARRSQREAGHGAWGGSSGFSNCTASWATGKGHWTHRSAEVWKESHELECLYPRRKKVPKMPQSPEIQQRYQCASTSPLRAEGAVS